MQGLGHWVLGGCRGCTAVPVLSAKGAVLWLSMRRDPWKGLQATLQCGSELLASNSSGKPVLLCFISFLLPGLLSPSAPGHAPVSQHA